MQIYEACKKVDRAVTHRPADHWIGYLVAVSGALMQMMSYGIDNSFSIFSNSMQNDPSLGYPSATTVSFGNSVSLGLSPVFGVLAGFLVDRVPPRVMMFTSTVMLFAALWLSSSFAKSSAEVTASYSLLASISSALMLSPGAAATGSWFRRRLGLGQGINFCGGGVGSAVVPAVLGSLVDVYGWRHTFRLMSAFCAIGLVATILSCRRHPIEDDVDVDDHARGGNSPAREPSHDDCIAHRSFSHEERNEIMLMITPEAGENAAASPTTRMIDSMRTEAEKAANHDNGDTLEKGGKPDAAASARAALASPGGSDDMSMLLGRHQQPQQQLAQHGRKVHGTQACTVADLIQDMHVRRLTWREMMRVFFSVRFLTHFFMFAIYGWSFYGLIYVAVPYVSSMGSAGTVYADVTPISTSKASTVFTFWGVFQIVGSILVGGVASFTDDALAYTMCATVGGLATSLLVFCRSYAAFAVCLSVVGFCTAGIFAMMPALIAKDFHGPNLGFFMGCVFVAGCLGGFSAPPIQAQLQTRYNGNYSYGCVFISCCTTFPGVLCYLLLGPEKQSRVGRVFMRVVEQA
ncbi:monocarboxylate transporter-like protein [Leishmania infantum JPCM5]|uniref:Monocarboxylate_transporter-like_protein n=2 Tax=Leishmania infantum TaxID=5671 RepID=A0A6L0WK11_LEIIN|nr:monocarboxylate transporter-like protein [Leishmania infantum JPCM5]CAC9443323.1 monocarboxylate_transporter-like_protein [Leishmania infantum]CAM65357.1 monocarboxylate transporter-like protein [Leishmania infantum JPCM5]SUZ38968.1 monocarboxylate_transporter-like_protein [Leishmania infantum]|eukprot:XP_001463011.1 monocarboxylate transporter-like protein [Leishmania infantum JPCM5]